MRASRMLSASVTLFVVLSLFPRLSAFAVLPQPMMRLDLARAVSGFSVRTGSEPVRYRFLVGDVWSSWEEAEVDDDIGAPGETESDLVMLPRDVESLEFAGISDESAVHLIEESSFPPRFKTAALPWPDFISEATPGRDVPAAGIQSILSRSEWGADESYLFEEAAGDASPAEEKGDNGNGGKAPDQRVRDCEAAQAAFPHEFKTGRTEAADSSGRKYRWPLQYSPNIKLLVVHHSGLLVRGDERPAIERVRALYKYHAVSRGWGDIGYNYVIDDAGQIYEGRQGGAKVVAGHAYCNNIGTLGIVLLGNFELEQPSQEQAKSLQWLLRKLAEENRIDLSRSVQYHGKAFLTPIVGHRDLLSTLCPGYYVTNVLSQVRSNVSEGRLDASVVFPLVRASSSSSAKSTGQSLSTVQPGISFSGRTAISINPGGKQRLSFRFTAPEGGAYQGKKIADIHFASPGMKLWVDDHGMLLPVATGILLPSDLPDGESLVIQVIVQAPTTAGNYTLDIGGMRFTLSVFGRRARTGDFMNPFSGNPAMIVRPVKPKRPAELQSKIRPQTRRTMQSSSASSFSFRSSVSSAESIPCSAGSIPRCETIRIRLSADPGVALSFADDGFANDLIARGGTTFSLIMKNGECQALYRGAPFTSQPLLRFLSSKSNQLTVAGVKGFTRSYRGSLECRVVNGALALINELPLEEYMAGLAEEPDTEPYQKQRAFAIAARTYAAYYMDTKNRKFPGLPYDGSDDPAVFQAYQGVDFESHNPEWARAVRSTANQVLFSGGSIIKSPYFSSDDGRTRSPEEAGWKNFPFASIFAPKEDPWCKGMTLRGHGVGMSGCGALGQAKEGRSAEQILQYYYPGVRIGEK